VTTPAPVLQYQRRLLVFIDVLGWSALTLRSNRSLKVRTQLTEVMRGIAYDSQFMTRFGDGWQAIALSDSWAVSFVPKEPGEVWTVLDGIAPRLAVQLIRQGCYARGAIVFGNLFHSGSVIVGPALVKAVQLEKAACYPRILIDPSARRWVPKQFVHIDRDGQPVLDYLSHSAQNDRLLLNNTTFLRKLLLKKVRKDARDPKLLAKHQWTLSYVDDVEAAAKHRIDHT
jgi:hypothetical protein